MGRDTALLIIDMQAGNLGGDAHSDWDTDLLTAPKVIAHHNRVLSDWFVTLKAAAEIELGRGGFE